MSDMQSTTEANQHPRNMLRRLSTIAKTVINKRRTSLQLLNLPTTPETPSSMDISENRKSQEEGAIDTPSTTAASTPVDKDGRATFLPYPKTIEDLEIVNRPSQDQHRPSYDQHRPSHDHHRSSHDQHRPSLDRHRPSLDQHRSSLDQHRSSLDQHRPSLDQHRPSLDQHRPQPEQPQEKHHEEEQQQQQKPQQNRQERKQEQEEKKNLETVMEPVSDKAPILCPLTPLSPTFISTDVYLETTVTDFHVEDKHPSKAAGDRTSTYLSPIQTQLHQPHPTHQLPHRSSAASDLSSAGTLAVSPSSPSPSTSSDIMQSTSNSCSNNSMSGGLLNSVSSSSSSIRSKTSSSAETVIMVRQPSSATTLNSSSSLIRQKFLAEKEARKATLRVGTSETIQARAECLQSPTASAPGSAGLSGGGVGGPGGLYTPVSGKGGYGAYYQARTAFDSTKANPARPVGDKKTKPPVKSLISFWEQVSDPMEM